MRKINKKGFTLIEVVLVLAIGGLIFLLAFLAFRNASINRRDTARRSDAGRFIAEIANYSGDANGKVPSTKTEIDKFQVTYLGGTNWKDPQGFVYKQANSLSNVQSAGTVPGPTNTYYFFEKGKVCDGNSTTTGGPNDYAIVMDLEKGQTCRDSGSK